MKFCVQIGKLGRECRSDTDSLRNVNEVNFMKICEKILETFNQPKKISINFWGYRYIWKKKRKIFGEILTKFLEIFRKIIKTNELILIRFSGIFKNFVSKVPADFEILKKF